MQATLIPSGTTCDTAPVNHHLKARTDIGLLVDGAGEWIANGDYVPQHCSGTATDCIRTSSAPSEATSVTRSAGRPRL